ncbi:MAG: flagellar basal body-associated FliL family protein [Bdellovibrionia bacterium]
MAEEKATEAEASGAAPSGQKPILLIALAVVNMIVVGAVGFMLFKNRQLEAQRATLDQVIEGEKQTQEKEKEEIAQSTEVGKVVPLETFIINLAGSKGRKVAKVEMALEINGESVAAEIDKRKAQVRDIIIIILSSKTYEEVSTQEGKDNLRSEIKETINSFLTSGKISNVFFTEFIYN